MARHTASLAPMLAMPSAMPADPHGFAFEFKWDGMRALVAVRRGRLRIVSRNALDQTERFPELAGLAASLGRDAVLDGEIVAFDAAGRPSFARLQSRFGLTRADEIRRQARETPAHFVAFDLLELDGLDLTAKPFRERRRLLEGLRFQGDSWATTPSHAGAGQAVLDRSRELGLEGIMAKRLDSPYLPGGRSPAWLKIRNRNRQEFVVGGWTEGEGGRGGTFGSLVLGVYDQPGGRARLRFVGKVGSGFRNADVERIQRALAGLSLRQSPFDGPPPKEAGMHFVQPRLVVEAEFNGLTRHGLLRQASFKGVRVDKDPMQVVWEQAEVTPWSGHSGADPSVLVS